MRRRALLILASTMLGVMMLSGIALAATISCGAISSEGHCYGTRRADTMTGNAERNNMSGKRGGDEMSALKGPDAIWGGIGDDRMFAGPGSDYVGDNKGSNLLSGGPGGDYLNAYHPPDSKPAPAFNVDRIKGGPGGDSIDATDGRKDLVNCGPGRDSVYFDRRLDEVENCERLNPQ
jgi:Ca2+-binding RTX toxin-like protein